METAVHGSIYKNVQAASTTSVNPSPADLLRTPSSKATSKELERIDSLFYAYVNRTSGLIETCLHFFEMASGESKIPIDGACHVPVGIESLCADMEVDHSDVRILMLAWKMQAERQGCFTLDEWRRGLKTSRADTIGNLKKALPELEKEVKRLSNYVDFYAYAFHYCLTGLLERSGSVGMKKDLIIGSRHGNNVFAINYKAHNAYKVINMDQWMEFFRFCSEISFPDFSNYDPELAWLLVLNNFVDLMRAKQG